MKKYICSYNYKNAAWGFEIFADSLNDAQNRLEYIRDFAVLDGEVKLKIPVNRRLKWIANASTRLFVFTLNFLRRFRL